jgi:hypothetical protein
MKIDQGAVLIEHHHIDIESPTGYLYFGHLATPLSIHWRPFPWISSTGPVEELRQSLRDLGDEEHRAHAQTVFLAGTVGLQIPLDDIGQTSVRRAAHSHAYPDFGNII